MPPPPPQSSPFAAIAQAIRQRVSDALGVGTAYIRLVANDRYPTPQAEPVQVYVQCLGMTRPADPGLNFPDAGAGNLARPVARRVRCYLYTRTSEDSYGGDEVALLGADATQSAAAGTPTAPGQWAYEEALANCLYDWTPRGTDGGVLTLGPLHPAPDGGPAYRKEEDDAGLVRSVVEVECCYLLSINPAEPNT